MKPQLVASWFGANPEYERMARVLRYSAERYCPGWDIRVEHIDPPRLESAIHNYDHVANTQKMEHWAQTVAAAPDGARLLLIDADVMVVRELDDLWSFDFDMAYTVREGARLPFNSGVVALRVSPPVRAFIETWRLEQRLMLADGIYLKPYRDVFGGINQAALGKMLLRPSSGLHVRALHCVEWNCEDSSWLRFDPNITRVVHIKSELRRLVFSTERPAPHLAVLVDRWRALEAEYQAGSSMVRM